MEDVCFNMPKIEGVIKIEKFDENGNLTYRDEGKNVIKGWVYSWLKNKMASSVCAWNPSQPYEFAWNSTSPQEFFRYVYLLNSSDTGNSGIVPSLTSEPCFPLPSGDYIGYLDRYSQTVGSDPKIGIINYNESYCTPSSAKFVYEWTTSKGNGTFDTIIHASDYNTRINDTSYNEVGFDSNVVSISSNSDNAIWKNSRPTVFCVYRNASNQLILCHTPVLSGVDLQYTETNLSLGSSVVQTITVWNNALSGSVPDKMCMYHNTSTGAKTIFFALTTYSSEAKNKICVFNGSTWTNIYSITASNSYGIGIDANYIYVKHYNNTLFTRYSHVGVSSGTVNVLNGHVFLIGSNIYQAEYSMVYDSSAATWSGETLTATRHKRSYPGISNNGSQIFDGSYYYFASFSAYVVGENSGLQTTTYALVRVPIESTYKAVESAHYKAVSPVTKSNTETMKITYTFNIS